MAGGKVEPAEGQRRLVDSAEAAAAVGNRAPRAHAAGAAAVAAEAGAVAVPAAVSAAEVSAAVEDEDSLAGPAERVRR
jgi:hypothetical protein